MDVVSLPLHSFLNSGMSARLLLMTEYDYGLSLGLRAMQKHIVTFNSKQELCDALVPSKFFSLIPAKISFKEKFLYCVLATWME